MRRRFFPALFLAALGASCGSPSTPDDPVRTPAPPSVTESFVATLGVGGYRFYSFSIAQYGTVNITLNAISGDGVASDTSLSVGVGKPDGGDCVTTTSVNTSAGAELQLTATLDPGVYCAKVTDVGSLPAPATFDVTLAHP